MVVMQNGLDQIQIIKWVSIFYRYLVFIYAWCGCRAFWRLDKSLSKDCLTRLYHNLHLCLLLFLFFFGLVLRGSARVISEFMSTGKL